MSYVQSFSSAAREIFEELIRKFAESSNETAGEHFTPRDTLSVGGELPPDGSRGRVLRLYSSRPLDAASAGYRCAPWCGDQSAA